MAKSYSVVCQLKLLIFFHIGKVLILTAVEARLKNTPVDTVARTGEDVRFRCSTESLDSVDWTYRKDESRSYRNIFIGRTGGGGDKSNGYLISQRIVVDVDIPSGQYDLIIRNVTQKDEGEHACFDISDQDSPASAKLTVFRDVSLYHTMKTSLEVVVEGDRIEIECTTNSSFGVDWKFRNATKEYGIYQDGVFLYPFNMEYSVANISYSSYKIFYLSIARVTMSNVGTYICLNGENNEILPSVELALLTIPVCEAETHSTENMTRFICNLTFIGHTSSSSEWIGDFCANSPPTTCSEASEGNMLCEFLINRKNRRFLQFAMNATFYGEESCEINCKGWEKISPGGFRTTDSSTSIQISALLQCHPYSSTTTVSISHKPSDDIANCNTPCATTTLIVIVLLGITNVASITVCIVAILKRKKVIIYVNRETSLALTNLPGEAPLPESEYTEVEEDQMTGQHDTDHASQNADLTKYMELYA